MLELSNTTILCLTKLTLYKAGNEMCSFVLFWSCIECQTYKTKLFVSMLYPVNNFRQLQLSMVSCHHHHHSQLTFAFSHLGCGWKGDNCPPHPSILHHILLHSQQVHVLHHTITPLFSRPPCYLRLFIDT